MFDQKLYFSEQTLAAYVDDEQGWGLCVILGIHQTPRLLPLHPMELFNGRMIIASVFGGFKGKSQLPHFAKECIKGVGYLL
jgi:alcohol dehydrogenase